MDIKCSLINILFEIKKKLKVQPSLCNIASFFKVDIKCSLMNILFKIKK